MESFKILSSKEVLEGGYDEYKSAYTVLLRYMPECTILENCMLFLDMKKVEKNESVTPEASKSSVFNINDMSDVYNINATILIRTSIPKTSTDMLNLYVVIERDDHYCSFGEYCIPQNYMPQTEIEEVLDSCYV
jgi:hypothetical protein